MPTGNLKSGQPTQAEVRWLHSARGSGPLPSFVSCLPASPSPPFPKKSMLMGTSWLPSHIILGVPPPPHLKHTVKTGGSCRVRGAGPFCQRELRAGTADGKTSRCSSCDGCERSYFEPRVESHDHLLTNLLAF